MEHFLQRKPSVIKEDIIYDDLYLNGESVLIIGGGPSARDVDLEGYSDIWSMNRFYLSPLKNIKLDLIAVGANTDREHPNYLEYVETYSPQLAYEIHPKWLYYKIDGGVFHTKIYGQIGVGVRLVNLAAALGAKRISFIGFDGPKAILSGAHYFEPGKTELPSMCTKEIAYEIHVNQYNFFWSYIRNLYPNTEFNSLDKTNELHAVLRTMSIS